MQYINIVGGSESMYDAVFGTHSFVVGFALFCQECNMP